uniref:Uncharacterized protein n=1 Tax=Chelonoidis abingdonii TaxID=106734 RepID=A0A8C0GGP5_CHEAB
MGGSGLQGYCREAGLSLAIWVPYTAPQASLPQGWETRAGRGHFWGSCRPRVGWGIGRGLGAARCASLAPAPAPAMLLGGKGLGEGRPGRLPHGPGLNEQEEELKRGLKRLYPAVDEQETPYIGLSQNNLRVHYKGESPARRGAPALDWMQDPSPPAPRATGPGAPPWSELAIVSIYRHTYPGGEGALHSSPLGPLAHEFLRNILRLIQIGERWQHKSYNLGAKEG